MTPMTPLFRNLFRKRRVEQDLNDEIRTYVEMAMDEKLGRAVEPAEARRQALVEFGGAEQVKEQVRAVRAGALIEQLGQDLRFGLRMLRKNPGFTAVAVLTIALGIGANSSIFSVFNDVVLRTLQLPDSGRLVDIYQTIHGNISRSAHGGFNLLSYPEYLQYRDQSHVFKSIAAYMPEIRAVLADGHEEIPGQLTTCNYFDTLRVKPQLGRAFLPQECATAEGTPVIVISDELWRNRYNSDHAILGKTIRLNRTALTIVGVAPPEFHGSSIVPASFWAPIPMAYALARMPGWEEANYLKDENFSWLAIIGRLNVGVSRQQAWSELRVIAARIDQHRPGRTTELSVETATLFGQPDMRKVALGVGAVVLISVGLILMIACANIANLMLARAAARTREIAVRLAMGASRARIVRQLLTESLLIATFGGVLGLIVSAWSEPALVKLVLTHIPDNAAFYSAHRLPDLRVIAYALALTVVTGVAFGLVPALQATQLQLNSDLKQEGSALSLGEGSGRLRGALLGTQVALCMVLLIAAGLLLRGLYHAQTVDPGFEMEHVVSVNFSLEREGYTLQRAATFNRALAERLHGLGGVETVVAVCNAPLGGSHDISAFKVAGESELRQMELNYIGPSFFSALSIPLVRGRDFSAAEVASDAHLVIVTESTAQRLFPRQDPVGKQVKNWRGETYDVIGVAKDAQIANLGKTSELYLFFPAGPKRQLDVKSLLVRTSGPAINLVYSIEEAASTLDPEMKIDVAPLQQNITQWAVPARICVALASALGLLGLLLASIGIYGTSAYAVARRVHEIGIRMALGAQAGDVKALVLRQAMRPVLIGAIVGVALCAAVSRLFTLLLFGISPLDVISFLSVAAFLLSVASIASYLPARRAVRVDPVLALRHE